MANDCASRGRSSGGAGRLDLHGVGVRGAMLRLRHDGLRILAAVLFTVAVLGALFAIKGVWLRMAACVACCVVVLVWWLSLKPTNDPPSEADLSRNAWAEIHSDQMVVHNVRDCKYRTEKATRTAGVIALTTFRNSAVLTSS